jgi:hypothetical protein
LAGESLSLALHVVSKLASTALHAIFCEVESSLNFPTEPNLQFALASFKLEAKELYALPQFPDSPLVPKKRESRLKLQCV